MQVSKISFFLLLSYFVATAFARLSAQFPDTIRISPKVYCIYLEPRKTVWGFIDAEKDSMMFPAEYEYLEYRAIPAQKTAVYMARKGGKYGMLSESRVTVVPFEYDELNYNLKTNYLYVKKDSLFGILERDGKPFIPIAYDDIMSDGTYYKVRKGKKVGLLNLAGKEIVPVCFDAIEDDIFLDNTLLQQGDNWTVLRWVRDNPCEMKVKYQQVELFNDFYLVKQNNKWGISDSLQNIVVPMDYLYIMPFFQKFLKTVLVVTPDKKMGLMRIDKKTGKFVEELPTIYDEIWVEEATAKIKVRQGKMRDYIYEGKPYLDMKYEDVFYYDRIEAFSIKEDKLWGLANAQGKVVLKPAYDKLFVIDGKNFVALKKNKWGMVGATGQVKIPFEYDDFAYDHAKRAVSMFLKKDNKWIPYKIKG
jgi:hypothetical protein